MSHLRPLLLLALASGVMTLAACSPPGAFASLPDTASETIKVYASECDQGDPAGCFAVGLAWWQADTNQQGLTRDDAQALRWMTRACELGNDAACTMAPRIEAGDDPIGTAPTTSAPTPHGVHAGDGSGAATVE